jgi:hypothetical protein
MDRLKPSAATSGAPSGNAVYSSPARLITCQAPRAQLRPHGGRRSAPAHLPRGQARVPLQRGQAVRHIEQLDSACTPRAQSHTQAHFPCARACAHTTMLLQDGGNDGLVLDRVEGAGTIHDAAADRSQLHRALKQPDLQPARAPPRPAPLSVSATIRTAREGGLGHTGAGPGRTSAPTAAKSGDSCAVCRRRCSRCTPAWSARHRAMAARAAAPARHVGQHAVKEQLARPARRLYPMIIIASMSVD